MRFGGGHTAIAGLVVAVLVGDNLLERDLRRKPPSVVHRAGSGYAFERRNHLGGAVEGWAAIGHA
uniref:Uncharacterized protein n=1 Tax=Oryza punctata TaxID=4537 RepID=A0A0E0LH55_ORYPU